MRLRCHRLPAPTQKLVDKQGFWGMRVSCCDRQSQVNAEYTGRVVGAMEEEVENSDREEDRVRGGSL